jgi:hypothetical protein
MENKRKKWIFNLGDYEHILIKFLEKDSFFASVLKLKK